LFRTILGTNNQKIFEEGQKIEEIINSKSGESENKINEAIYQSLKNYKEDLGEIEFKNMKFSSYIEVESVKSHGKICSISHPKQIRTEIGDVLFNVDHIFISKNEHPKIINGVSSVIQTKKEDYVEKQGIDINQLYLMTQWPPFLYRGKEWDFDVFKDIFSFYLFITKNQRNKSSIISSSLLLRLLNLTKSTLPNHFDSKIKLSNTNLLYREKINNASLPFSFASFFIRMFNLSIGSQSLSVRNFCRDLFFPEMEEVEDCPSLLIQEKKPISILDDVILPQNSLFLDFDNDDDEFRIIRIKIFLKQLE
jgi:hypothetical protein